MNKQKGSTHSPPPNTLEVSISALSTNLRLLDLDQCNDWRGISAQTFFAKEALLAQKTRIHCVEWILYRLWQQWDQDECSSKLQPFFPPLEPLQSLNLRAALFRCLSDLKKNGILGKDITLRKSMFDDCRGEMIYNLLLAFSTVVVQRVLIPADNGKRGIVGESCVGISVPLRDTTSMLPLVIAHRTSLRGLLSKKCTLKAKYRELNDTLRKKDKELASKFNKVMEIQDFLDKNPPSEITVERVSRVFDQNWQGDHRVVEVIAQGEEQGLRDALLDHRFEAVWSDIDSGKCTKDTSLSHYGLLEDLEKRVALQKARLEKWQGCKGDLEQRQRPRVDKTTKSPVRHTFRSPHSYKYEQRNGKDLVFSPRKSPRKSVGPVRRPTEVESPASPKFSGFDTDTSHSTATFAADLLTDVVTSPLAAKSIELTKSMDRSSFFSSGTAGGEDNNLDFSEIITRVGTVQEKQIWTGLCEQLNDVGERSLDVARTRDRLDDDSFQPQMGESIEGMTGFRPQNGGLDDTIAQEKPNVENLLVERLPSSAADPSLTLPEQRLSLIQRTRQSMAYISPERNMPSNGPSPSIASWPKPPNPVLEDASVRATLVQRTRQSISLASTMPKCSSHSKHARRASKIYPTNQFETPRRPQSIQKMTPPEELMSPGAGYDSVFKSRPKVAFSPTNSPIPYPNSAPKVDIDSVHVDSQMEDSLLASLKQEHDD